ncbi:hypothetical protein R3W88_033222 [Solanum pinnatisectum]|uniref:Ubiquitin-like protease family profile domain-containing protein n=1 Tax=Solanum pinnatisectum TaxID=50273 RepID=A0AAV9K1X3_9SOLN|nr:hypothetical protein R3W88_033222 [Solanum pinnatisectum]
MRFYVPVNYNGEFHWVLAIVVLKERTNRKLCSEIQKLSTLLAKYFESSGFFIKRTEPTGQFLNLTRKEQFHPLEVRHVIGIAQQASNCLDCGLFVAAYAGFFSDGLQEPSYGISSETLHMRYASLL